MQTVWMPGGVRTEIHLTGADTGGAFCLFVDEPPTGWALPSHRHADEDETIHVISGAFSMTIDGIESTLGPGETVFVPRGVQHSGSGSGRRVVMFTPSGMEGFFFEIGVAEPEINVEIATVLAAAQRHGWSF